MSPSPAVPPASSSPPRPSAADPRPQYGRVLLFMVLATAGTVAMSIPFATGLLPQDAVGVLVPVAQLFPLIAALLVRRRGQKWWRSLALTVPSWKALGIAALAGVAAFVMVPLIRVLIGFGAGGPAITDAPPLLSLLLAVPAVFVMQAVFAFGEETGWRGWLHTELAPLGFWVMSLSIGVLWALWHLPIVIAFGFAPREAITYLVTIVAVAPLLSAMREISGTAWAAVIGHGLFNSVRVALEQNILGSVDPGLAWVLDIVSWVLWIAVAWVVLRAVGPGRTA